MGKVKVLDKHTAELIAAGEVVERPASVVKELVENSIDAGAGAITIELKGGGVRYIRITDDGEGISHDDVPTAFLRHATSKIKEKEDLDAISTLGFRGEALASIAAVARVEMITRTADEENGTHFVIEGGETVTYDECGCAKGTTIIIKDIFYNTPARMKFLKKDVYEGNAVATLVDRIALSHPEVSIRLIREGKQTLMTSGDGQLKNAIYSVFGREFSSGLIPVNYALGNVKVSGFTSKPTESRPNRSMQVFFINGRYCRSTTMQTALEQAYKGSIMVGKHPACVLNVDIDCSAVDVNVHPAKLEVRFTNERPVFEGVYYAVKSSLEDSDERREAVIKQRTPEEQRKLFAPPEKVVPVQTELPIVQSQIALQPENPKKAEFEAIPVLSAAETKSSGSIIKVNDSGFGGQAIVYPASPRKAEIPVLPRTAKSFGIDISADDEFAQVPIKQREEAAPVVKISDTQPVLAEKTPLAEAKEYINDIVEKPETQKEIKKNVKPNNFSLASSRIIGEAFETYIIIEKENELILIDKHAAHERLIYERLIAGGTESAAQTLLEPLTVTLEKTQYNVLLDNTELMSKAGFEIDDFGPGTVIVRAVPMIMCDFDIPAAVMEIADNLTHGKMTAMTERLDNMYHTIACRSAIKAHDRSLDKELEALVMQLAENTDIRYCPHGRPISITITKREIEKNFGRT